ncbi:MAG: PBSX family phage terminase large subunit [Lachnospirales bacterium]
MDEISKIYLPDIVGGGYKDFWNSEHKFRVLKGGRGSKKSSTTALNLIYRLMKNDYSNLLVVRKTYASIKDSCYNQLIWAISTLNVSHLWLCKTSPLEMVYKPTGQKIYFRGLENSMKISSITTTYGHLCWLWVEEAFEIPLESDFDTLVECIRGDVGENLFKQITVTFNPWNEKHWLKQKFFDKKSFDTFTLTTNYMCNEWLDYADLQGFEKMKEENPKRYNVAGLGAWGVSTGLVYEGFKNQFIVKNEDIPNIISCYIGVDYGHKNPTTFVMTGISDTGDFYVLDEYFHCGRDTGVKSPNEYCRDFILWLKSQRTTYLSHLKGIYVDPSATGFIEILKEAGVKKILKGKNDILQGIEVMNNLIYAKKFFINSNCENTISEIYSYRWSEKISENLSPIKEYDHTLDAIRYVIYSNKKIFMRVVMYN